MAQPDLPQQRANVRKILEKKINGVKVGERINPDTGNPFTDQEIDDMINDPRKYRSLFCGGMGASITPTGP